MAVTTDVKTIIDTGLDNVYMYMQSSKTAGSKSEPGMCPEFICGNKDGLIAKWNLYYLCLRVKMQSGFP